MVVSELDQLICFGSYEDVKSYIECNPLSVQEQCLDSGTLPLHRALRAAGMVPFGRGGTGGVIFTSQLLISTYPEGLTINKDHNGHVPLHAVVRYVYIKNEAEMADAKCMELLVYVLNALPATLLFCDLEGKTPLEYAIIRQKNFEYATYLLQNHWGPIPAFHASNPRPILHEVLETNALLEFLHFLMSKVDQCIQAKDVVGDLPLHVVCIYNGMPYGVVKMILNAYPSAIKAEDSQGDLTLSMELQQEAMLDVIHFLADKYPKAFVKATSNGLLPIDYAVTKEWPLAMEIFISSQAVFPKMKQKKYMAVFSPSNAILAAEAVHCAHFMFHGEYK